MGLFEVVIPKMSKFGAKNLNFIRVRIGYVMLILMLFAPQMSTMFIQGLRSFNFLNKHSSPTSVFMNLWCDDVISWILVNKQQTVHER